MSGTTRVSRYQKGKTRKIKTNLDLLEQEIVSCSGICWAICKPAPHPRQPCQHPTTQFFASRMPFLPPNQQRQSTEGKQFETKHWRLSTNYPPIGNGLWRIKWWRHRWRHMTFKGQGRDPNIVKACYFENGSRQRLGFNWAPSPSPTHCKSCKKITWRTYALSERILVMHMLSCVLEINVHHKTVNLIHDI